MTDVLLCFTCEQEKSPDAFYRNANGKPRRPCKECVSRRNAADRARRRADPTARAQVAAYAADYYRSHRGEWDLRRWRERIGPHVTAEAVAALLQEQGPRCAICSVEADTLPPSKWHLDHDHETGALRGFLCHHCNLLLGHARDDASVLRAAAAYLETRTA